MKHSTFRKSSLISSVALLLVAIVALSGATFAWFSSKGEATATGIRATTQQSSNLVISDKMDSGWTQNLSLAETDGKAKTLIPVTTNDLTTWYKAEAENFNTQVADGYSEASSATDYIVKRIYVMLDADENSTMNLQATINPTINDGTDGKSFYRVAIAPVAGISEGDNANGLSNTSVTDPYYYAYQAPDIPETATYAQYEASTVNNVTLGTITAKAVYAYDVFVWFEGEDANCIDSYSANDVTLDIDFAPVVASN